MSAKRIRALRCLSLTVIAIAGMRLPAAAQVQQENWYPFVITAKLDETSAANAGAVLLDAPAGKHGFVQTKGKHFYFEDGTPVRFWGTNLCFSACFPTKEEAKMLASRIAFFGFNAVRLHHMDFSFEPNGIFKDTCPGCNVQDKTTRMLSPAQLDKLDYLIYELKKRGIYININLLVSRSFTRADGVKDAATLKRAAKPVSMVDTHLINLQKEYAQNLLTHYNPYTGLRLNEDPAVCMVEIVNENSVFKLHTQAIPPYYKKQVNALWRRFPKNAYRSEEEAKDAFFTQMEKNYFDEMVAFLRSDCGLTVPLTGIGGYRFMQSHDAMNATSYVDTHAYWDHPYFPNTPWDKNDFTTEGFSLLKDRERGIIATIIERTPDSNKPYTVSEWNHCFPNPYAYETPVLLASTALRRKWAALFQFAFSHNRRFYPESSFIENYFDITANAQQLLLHNLAGRLFLNRNTRPHSSVKNGIVRLRSRQLAGASGSIGDVPLSLGTFRFRSDTDGAVFITSCDNAPLWRSQMLLLITVAGIKNTESRWQDGSFNWGRAPVLLQKMNVSVSLRKRGTYVLYPLDGSGRKGEGVRLKSHKGTIRFSTKTFKNPWFLLAAEDH